MNDRNKIYSRFRYSDVFRKAMEYAAKLQTAIHCMCTFSVCHTQDALTKFLQFTCYDLVYAKRTILPYTFGYGLFVIVAQDRYKLVLNFTYKCYKNQS